MAAGVGAEGGVTLAPFPWFGGKSRAAPLAWAAMGAEVDNYVEPFAGSLAVLLGRPGTNIGTETVNDADGLLVNAWRAMRADPWGVAEHADWPVSECDLTARHLRLVGERAALTERLQVDADFYDARLAGWWVWGACCWIGSGWCSGKGPWRTDGERWVNGNAGRGIHRQLTHIGDAGQGIHRQLPHIGDAGGDASTATSRRAALVDWFGALSARLERVRICCGDWRRVLTDSVTIRHGTTGVLLDPPYPDGWDTEDAYSAGTAGADTWHEAAAWAAEHGADRRLRIVLCGYAGTWTAPPGWREVPWVARKGYAADAGENSARERLWLSPGCLDVAENRGVQVGMFGGAP